MNHWTDPQVIVSITTGVIATCALIVTSLNAYQTRKHQRLTVRPHLTIHVPLTTNDHVGIVFRNDGGGLLIINEIKLIPPESEEITFRDASIFEKIPLLQKLNFSLHVTPSSIAISPKETYWLMKGDDTLSKDDINAFAEALSGMKLVCEYQSIYEQKYKYESVLFCVS